MGMYKYLTRLWQDAKDLLEPIKRERILQWRKQPAIVRIKKPTRIDKARRLGYKAKQGFVIVRARIKKGGRKREKPRNGKNEPVLRVIFQTENNTGCFQLEYLLSDVESLPNSTRYLLKQLKRISQPQKRKINKIMGVV